MSGHIVPAEDPVRRRQRLVRGVAAVAGVFVTWLAAYRVNGPWWNLVVYRWWSLDPRSRWGSGLHFFLYDTVKIVLLLVGIIFVVTVLRSYMSVERTRALLGGRREGVGNVMASGLGVVTPFCSCSAVPAFIGFVAAGVPIGVTLSFLIASPLVNEVAIALLLGMFGPGIAALYVAAGLTVAVVAGWVLGRLGVQRWVEPFVFQTRLGGKVIDSTAGLTLRQRFQMGREEVRSILGRIWPYLLVGIGLGAVIHGWAPQDFFARYAGADNPLGVLVAVVVGTPLYSNAAGVMPLVQALHDKGLPMGTLLAFMMSVVALSLPELILLRRVLKPPLLAAFVAVTATGIVAVGYLFNLVLA
ncbi:permease [Nucisporomicrobium flavum]|uniref:permease n=1 Tax=Nucisporomicrobium flavum TaxID=2785915 RepID=UPI003C2B3E65